MAVSTQALVRDNSTLANFKQWAQAISTFFSTAGWLQSSDTGQVNWSTISSVPAVNTYVYEIWQPNDGLTNFYLKMEYGTNAASSNTGPSIRVSAGTGTNGAGTLTGFALALATLPSATSVSVTSTSTQWQCHFSGAPGRMAVIMWRDETASAQVFFAVERSLNASGAYIATHFTLLSASFSTATSAGTTQQSLVFGVGVGNQILPTTVSAGFLALGNISVASDLFNGNIPVSPVFPSVGYFDNPLTVAGIVRVNDITEGSQYLLAAANMPYGVAHNYIASRNGVFASPRLGANAALLMRYD